MSDISVEARGVSDPGGAATPNCVDCSRGIEHRECTVLHLLDGGWVIEHGSHREQPAVPAASTDAGAASR